MIETVNPATGQRLKTYPFATASEVETCLIRAERASSPWANFGFRGRGECWHRLGQLLMKKAEHIAAQMTEEMGKPIAESLSEVAKCAGACAYYADHSEDLLKDQAMVDAAPRAYVHFQPLGLIFAIMPWNFPLWQVIRFAAPTSMAGNVIVVKHAPSTAGCGETIAELFAEAGFPEGAYQNLPVDIPQIEQLLADRRIAGLSLTGSTRAGRSVAEIAGRHLKKVVLELGGSDPYIICEDADLDVAAEKCVQSRMLNGGQSCIAAKRFIVHKKVSLAFTERFVALMREYKWGDPMDPQIKLGPMARLDLRDQIHAQVQKSLKDGAQLLLGGQVPEQSGFFYPPTVLTRVKPGMAAFDEELFGPVGVIVEADSEDHALALANQTEYGLGAAIFSRDTKRAESIARDGLRAGLCFVNDFVRSDVRWPFGGIRNSGLGRELSFFGALEFVNVKSVVVF